MGRPGGPGGRRVAVVRRRATMTRYALPRVARPDRRTPPGWRRAAIPLSPKGDSPLERYLMDAVTQVPPPRNEPNQAHAPGSPERARLEERLKELASERVELTMTIGGARHEGGGHPFDVVAPHDHKHVLGTARGATQQDTRAAIDAALTAARAWRAMDFDDRAAIFLRAADLLAGPWRETLNASTM